MGFREHEELYLSLSRKELQGLCRQHGLPVNRSKIQLANSLEVFYKRKNAILSHSVEASLGALPSTESNLEEPMGLLEGTGRDIGAACHGRIDASEADNSGRTTLSKGDNYHFGRHSETADQEINNHIDIQTPDKALETATSMVCACPANRKATEGFVCSAADADTAGTKPLLATDAQEITASPQFGLKCHDNSSKNASTHFSLLKNSHDKSLCSKPTARICNLPFAPRSKSFGEGSSENGLLSSSDTSAPLHPSLQFFVRSEEGLNLFVDFSSTPAEWIKSLKDEVFMSQKLFCSKSQLLCHEIRGLGNVNEKSRTSSARKIETDLQKNGTECNNRCNKSSLSSILNENWLPIAISAGVNDGTSRSSALESSSNPVEKSGYLYEGNHMVSSSCTNYSDLKNCKKPDVLSCPRDGEMYPHNSAGTSFIMNKIHAPLLDDLLNTFTDNSVAKSSANGIKESEKLTLKTGGVNFQTKICPALCDEIQENRSCQISSTSGSKETNLLEVGGQQKDGSTILQFGGRQVVGCQVKDVQEGATESANDLLEHKACGGQENSVPETPTLTFTEEQGTCILLEKKENSECSQSSNSVVKASKRSRSSDLLEKFQSKRQHCRSKKHNITTMSLRSSKALAKTPVNNPVVFPRRSVRLMSK